MCECECVCEREGARPVEGVEVRAEDDGEERVVHGKELLGPGEPEREPFGEDARRGYLEPSRDEAAEEEELFREGGEPRDALALINPPRSDREDHTSQNGGEHDDRDQPRVRALRGEGGFRIWGLGCRV